MNGTHRLFTPAMSVVGVVAQLQAPLELDPLYPLSAACFPCTRSPLTRRVRGFQLGKTWFVKRTSVLVVCSCCVHTSSTKYTETNQHGASGTVGTTLRIGKGIACGTAAAPQGAGLCAAAQFIEAAAAVGRKGVGAVRAVLANCTRGFPRPSYGEHRVASSLFLRGDAYLHPHFGGETPI